MKITILLSIAATLMLSSCSGMKFKNIRSSDEFDRYNKLAVDKNPKEVKTMIGQPMHAFYNKEKTMYQLAYPMSNEEVTMAGVMFNKELSCFWFNFDKKGEGDYRYQAVNFGKDTSCQVNHNEIAVSPSLID